MFVVRIAGCLTAKLKAPRPTTFLNYFSFWTMSDDGISEIPVVRNAAEGSKFVMLSCCLKTANRIR